MVEQGASWGTRHNGGTPTWLHRYVCESPLNSTDGDQHRGGRYARAVVDAAQPMEPSKLGRSH